MSSGVEERGHGILGEGDSWKYMSDQIQCEFIINFKPEQRNLMIYYTAGRHAMQYHRF